VEVESNPSTAASSVGVYGPYNTHIVNHPEYFVPDPYYEARKNQAIFLQQMALAFAPTPEETSLPLPNGMVANPGARSTASAEMTQVLWGPSSFMPGTPASRESRMVGVERDQEMLASLSIRRLQMPVGDPSIQLFNQGRLLALTLPMTGGTANVDWEAPMAHPIGRGVSEWQGAGSLELVPPTSGPLLASQEGWEKEYARRQRLALVRGGQPL